MTEILAQNRGTDSPEKGPLKGSRTSLFFDRISGMGKYFRKWYLLGKLGRKSLQGARDANTVSQIVNNLLWVEKARFLSDIAKRRFFVFPRSKESQNARIIKDLRRIDECLAENPLLIVQSSAGELGLTQIIPELGKDDAFIRITGHGDEFSDWMNFFFVHLPAKYKWMGYVFFTACTFIWVYFLVPHIFPQSCKSLLFFPKVFELIHYCH